MKMFLIFNFRIKTDNLRGLFFSKKKFLAASSITFTFLEQLISELNSTYLL